MNLNMELNLFSWFAKLADCVVYRLFSLSSESHLGEVLHFFIEDVTKIFCLIFLVTATVSFFRSKLNAKKIRLYLNEKPKWSSYLLAVILGAITPFCSCSSIPLFIGFVEAGIPFGITMAFLITSPMINEVAIFVFASIVGWQLASVYILTGMSIGFIGGWLMGKLGFEKYVKDYSCDGCQGKCQCEGQETITTKQRIFYAIDYAKSIIKKIWFYVFFGIGIGAFLHGYVPQAFFIKYAGESNIFAVPLVVILGIPLYSNATGIIPVAEVLLGKGVPIGTVLAMIMSVVAISFPEMVILSKILEKKFLFYFALFLCVMFIVVGYLYNVLF